MENRMRKAVGLLVAVCMFLSLMGGCDKGKVDERFMTSLAEGLSARWVLTNAEDDDVTREDWEGYLDAEYSHISKYADEEFENEELGELAHKYIDLLEDTIALLPHFGTEKWEKEYSKGIYNDRCIILMKIDKICPIPVPEEDRATLMEIIDNAEIRVFARNLINSIEFKKSTNEYGNTVYEAVAENTTDTSFSYFALTIDLRDEDDVTVESYRVPVEHWDPGEKVRFSLTLYADIEYDTIEVVHANWNY